MNGRENITEHRHCTNWGGLVIQASVNWIEDLDNRISSGRVICWWLIVASANLCLK